MPAGRNVRVSMMVECFGIYMFFSRMCLGIGYLCLGTYFCFGAGVFCSSVLFPGWSSCGYCAELLMMDRNCPKHVEFHFKSKFVKLVHLVGFIIRMTGWYL